MRCVPGQYALIMRSHCGNEGRIVRTVKNIGQQGFRRVYQDGVIEEIKPDVWCVEQVKTPIIIPHTTAIFIRSKFGAHIVGLFPDRDLLPLDNPKLVDEIINEAIREAQKSVNARILRDRERKRQQ